MEKIFAVSGMTGATPWHVTDQGLMLKTITTYRIAGGNMGGIKMEFCPIPFSDPCTPSATHCYGGSCTSGTAYATNLTARITSIEFCCAIGAGSKYLDHFNLILADG